MRVRTLLNPFKAPQEFSKPTWSEVFPSFGGALDVEIGFGSGSFIQRYAHAEPSRCVVGFEIRKKLVEMAQENVTVQKLSNAYLVWGNGQAGLRDMFEDKSIDRLIVLHPDPWPKRRHQKRRVISQEFLILAHQKLKSGHHLYVATDVEELWHDMYQAIQESQHFDVSEDDLFWESHYQTRWKEMSLQNSRAIFSGTFKARE